MINTLLKYLACGIIIMTILPVAATAQLSVTFKVNLTPQLKDSVYVPGRDQIYLKGNVFPLSASGKEYLEDVAPTDSIYQATVDFPITAKGKKLAYNFFISTPNKVMKEQMPRYLQLRGDTKLDALYFNSFAW